MCNSQFALTEITFFNQRQTFPCQIKHGFTRSKVQCYTYHKLHQFMYDKGGTTGTKAVGTPGERTILTNEKSVYVSPCNM